MEKESTYAPPGGIGLTFAPALFTTNTSTNSIKIMQNEVLAH